jgi:hypothetical protein
MKLMLLAEVTAVSPTGYGSVSNAWELVLLAQVTALSPTACVSVSHTWNLCCPRR